MKLTDYFIQIIILLHLAVVGLIKPEVAERAKRMLFVTSLATALAKEGIIKRNALDTLNTDLKLAKNDHCLLLGKELSKGMWSHSKLNGSAFEEGIYGVDIRAKDSFLSLNDIKLLGNKVISATPKWVKYDSNRMHEDMTDFFITHPVMKNINISR